jgi:hypothetical protein
MKPPDPDAESLLSEWIEKAEADLEAAAQLAPHVATSARLREVVGFHCQQAVEKFLKALLTYYQVEFPKTHDIERLLTLVGRVGRRAMKSSQGDRDRPRGEGDGASSFGLGVALGEGRTNVQRGSSAILFLYGPRRPASSSSRPNPRVAGVVLIRPISK